MSDSFLTEYDVTHLEKITTRKYGFDLFVTPRYKGQYVQMAYEEMTSLLVRQNAKGVKTFIDVGAHFGFFDVLVGLSNPQCRILAFEPVSENHQVLTKNLSLHDLNALPQNYAVSDQPGIAQFQISEASDNSGFVANPVAGTLKNIEVEVVCLDRYLDQIPDGPVLVKIDTEGNEIKVLDGMRKIIEKCSDLRLVIEFSPMCLEANGVAPEALRDTLDQLGFDVFIIHEDKRRYEKYRPGLDWRDIVGEKTHKNLFCVKKDRSLSLCSFSHSSALLGAERSLLEMVGNLIAENGTICTVVLPNEGPLRFKLADLGVATVTMNYKWWGAQHMPNIDEVNTLMQTGIENMGNQLPILEIISPDVILTSTLVIPWGAVAAFLLSRPHIWWVQEYGQQDHGLEFYFTFQKTLDIIREASNHVVVNSEAVKESLFKETGADKCTVASYNVVLEESGRTGKSFFQHPNSVKLIAAGAVMKTKGQDDAVHAVKRLLESGYDVELSLLGDARTPFAAELMEFVRAEKLDDRIHFYGFFENVREVIEQADIGLTCSRNEAFGRVTAETLLMGKPVIGTNTGGTAELIEDGVDGFLYSPGNVDELAKKIAFFADSPEKIREFGERAPQNISKKLSKNPVDLAIYQICQNIKREPNPGSTQLVRLIIRWQQSAVQELLLKRQEFAEIHASQAWKNALILGKIRDRLAPFGSLRARMLRRIIGVISFPFRKKNKELSNELALIRSSALFDADWYLANNPDIARVQEDPASHYLLTGGFEGRDPSPYFDSSWYLDAYLDVRKTGINPLVHYLKYGIKEDRYPK